MIAIDGSGSATQERPILIIEDARADRARFRLLLDRSRRTGFEFAWKWQPEAGCSVRNWFDDVTGLSSAGQDEEHASFHEFLGGLGKSAENILRERIGRYKVVFLDLAWTGSAEGVMQTAQYLDRKLCLRLASYEGNALASRGAFAFGKPGPLDDSRGDVFPSLINVEGIAFLEWLRGSCTREQGGAGPVRRQNATVPEGAQRRLPLVCITSAYVPETADGLRAFLRERYGALGIEILHKWMGEHLIRDRLDRK